MQQTQAQRERGITRTSLIGIAANLFLVGFKAGAGLVAGSIAILLDAVNNLTDALSSVITIIGIKLARRQPDKKHPFGHGRVEYFSAILISGIVLAAGATSLIESVKKIIHPEPADYSVVTLVIVSVAIVTKLILGRFVTARGKKFNSDALLSSGADATFDAVISASTLIGALVTMLWHVTVDGLIGALISVFILKAGVEMLLHPINQLVGFRPDSEVTRQIRADVAAVDGVQGAYDLVLHNYGPNAAIGSIHVEVPDTLTARDVHLLTMEIQHKIIEKYHVFLTVGIYAVDTKDPEAVRIRGFVSELALSHEGVMAVHGFFIHDGRISFDIVTAFTVRDRGALCRHLKEEIEGQFPGYTVTINVDTDYSD